jgi:nitrogen fixation protein NifB
VAPRCNIKCNYCNRRYDCLNESRPGVTSAVLAPHQALAYLQEVLAAEPRISVAGIAGPGDPMANAPEVLETMRLVKEHFPDILLCLSSNGLGVVAHMDELAELGVGHVTITVNTVDPAVGERIYAYVRDGKVVYRGREAAELLLSRQEEAVRGLKERGIIVKLNTIVAPGYNDHQVAEVAAWGAARGVDLMNLIPLYPVPDTPFADLTEPSRETMNRLRKDCGPLVKQMTHCTRCRADAVGILGQDRKDLQTGCLARCATLPKPVSAQRPYVAVATREGALVNLHLGQAQNFSIYAPYGEGFALMEKRSSPLAGDGELRWQKLSEILKDCRAVLVSGVGETPRRVLGEAGIQALEMNGFIEEGLRAVYSGGDLSALAAKRGGKVCCGGGRGGGDGMGCL